MYHRSNFHFVSSEIWYFSLGGSNKTLHQCWIAFIHPDPDLIPPKSIPRRSKATLYTVHYLDFQVLWFGNQSATFWKSSEENLFETQYHNFLDGKIVSCFCILLHMHWKCYIREFPCMPYNSYQGILNLSHTRRASWLSKS